MYSDDICPIEGVDELRQHPDERPLEEKANAHDSSRHGSTMVVPSSKTTFSGNFTEAFFV